MARALKIYRTAIGFHDAYVAAASQKAALEAWGSDKDLFSRGAAEMVAETPFADELLAEPGVVVKKLRGTAEEQLAALPPTPAKKPPKAAVPRKPAPTPKPRPSRAKLDEAEHAFAEAEQRHEAAMRDIAEREAAIARERRELAKAQRGEAEALEKKRDAERRAYDAAVRRWTD